ncbi:MAG: FecR family protein [Candidatus Omnitrophota bacterium]
MKKISGFAGLLAVALLFQAHSAAAAPKRAVISNLQGSATIVRDGQTLPASAGMVCEKKDVIRTGPQCTLDLAMNDVAGCRLLASTEGALMKVGKRNMHLKIASGNAILNLKRLSPASTFKVETPTAVAAVRGTQFWGRVDLQKAENPVTTFAVRSGTVEVLDKASGKNFTLQQGQALDIPKDMTTPPSTRTALAGEMAAMEQASSIKTSA